MERKKTVLLCVTGGIAAYKIATLASMLVKTGYDVKVVMTQNATNFINPLVFETLTQHKCLIDTFDRNFGRGCAGIDNQNLHRASPFFSE